MLPTQGAIAMANAALDFAYQSLLELGPIEERQHELWAGDHRLSGDTELVDGVQTRFGFGCTLFLANVRVATTATAAGSKERALGTEANARVTQRVYRSGQKFEGIAHTLGKDWLIVYAPLRATSGRIIGMVATFRELVEFLEELDLLDDVPEAVVLADPEGQVVDMNRAAADMLGASKDKLRWRMLQGVTGGEMAELRAGERPEVERSWRRIDGHEVPVRLSLVRHDVGGLPRILAIAWDFTEQHEARERLRALNAELASLNASLESMVGARTRALRQTLAQRSAMVDQLSDGFIATDVTGCVELHNPAMARMMGALNPAWRGRPAMHVHPDLAALCGQAQAARSVKTAELVLSQERIGEVVVSPIEMDGACIGTVALVRDITEAKALDRMKSDFIATVSHELRTPMTSIMGFAKISRRKLAGPVVQGMASEATEARRALDQVTGNLDLIIGEGERLGALIDDVLDLSKIEAGEVDWQVEALDPRALVSHAVEVTAGLFTSSEVTCEARFEPHVPPARGDWSRILQVLVNLISNAAKFTEHGEVIVSASQVGSAVEFSVEDTGVGIAPDQRDHIFARFKQAADPLMEKPTGTGLGLAISARIITAHGGHIAVESEPKRGSRFSFLLRVAQRERSSPVGPYPE